jgi:hypothetical protein
MMATQMGVIANNSAASPLGTYFSDQPTTTLPPVSRSTPMIPSRSMSFAPTITFRPVKRHHASISPPEIRNRVAPMTVGGMCFTATAIAIKVDPHKT